MSLSKPAPESRPKPRVEHATKKDGVYGSYDAEIISIIRRNIVIDDYGQYRGSVFSILLMSHTDERNQQRRRVEAKVNDTRTAAEILRRFYPDEIQLISTLDVQFDTLIAFIAGIDKVSELYSTSICPAPIC